MQMIFQATEGLRLTDVNKQTTPPPKNQTNKKKPHMQLQVCIPYNTDQHTLHLCHLKT